MVFSSLFFLFVFLVACYGLYAVMPSLRARNILLLVFSLFFYAWGGPVYVGLLCLMTFVCFVGALLLHEQAPGSREQHIYLWVTVGVCLALLVIFKYTDFLVGSVQSLFGWDQRLVGVVLPIGISFYTFQLISYVVDVYRGDTLPQRSYWKLLLYAALFHQCIAGPIVRYSDVREDIHRRRVTSQDRFQGVMRFTVGLAKKAVLANACASVADTLLPSGGAEAPLSSLTVLIGMLAYAMQVYLDFSAYSDMAIGLGQIVGFHYRENFLYPYVATSVTDFWRRWHISLSSFFRDYVYIPLGGSRCAPWRHMLNILVVWCLTGLWHGASWNFVLWGLYFALMLLLEKFVFRWSADARGPWRPVRRLYTLVVVFFSWFLFRFEDMAVLGRVLGALFGAENGFMDMTARTALTNHLFILGVCALACTPIIPWLASKLRTWRAGQGMGAQVAGGILNAVCALAPMCLLLLSTLALVGNTYNPFLYFRF